MYLNQAIKKRWFFLLVLIAGNVIPAHAVELPDRKEVLRTMIQVNDYFMEKYADYKSPSHTDKVRPSNIWTRGVYYEGLMALHRIYPQEKYYRYMHDWAEFHRWGMRNGNTTRNADDQCCGQTYIDLYNMSPDPNKIRNIKACMDMLVNTPQVDDWSWIDAIQMAMPVLAKLGKLTGDERYLDKMYQMYSFTRNNHGGNGLFCPQEGLWWRDADFVPPYKETNGKNCYWSRGNGWVYAALARVMDEIPADEIHRAEYLADFRSMSEALKNCQREDGFWNVSLHNPANFGGKETIGSSLFVYGMAWGINNRVLDRETYWPVVLKAWNALVKEAVHPNGFLGWVQGTGKGPKDGQPVTYHKIPDFEDYGTGCFLLGASEIYKMVQQKPKLLFIGDSTVKNGSGDGRNGQWGWGDQIACFFDTAKIDVVNRAIGGRSSRTFISEGRWKNILQTIHPGDYILIQFGHNDGSPINDTARARGTIAGTGEETVEIVNLITKQHEVVHTFGWYLRKYITDTKAKGATPVILSPVPRDNFIDSKTIRNGASYGGWARQVAESENVPFIDLNELVAGEYDQIIGKFGQAVIDSIYFYGDHTHTSLTGAKLNARQVVAGIRTLPNCSLKDYLLNRQYGALSDENSFSFSIPLPEGDYDVTLVLGNPDKASETTVRGESRRLLLEKIKTKKGKYSEQSFTINVRNKQIGPSEDVRIKPREMNKLNWDDLLSLEFTGVNPSVQSIRIRPAEHPLTVFLCGNSTVVDQDNEPWCGWGQMIPRFFRQGISFANYAESGESANTFIAAGRLEKILTQAKAGDYIFVEFGHNDQKQKGEGIGPWSSFSENLRTFIAEAKKRGMYPVLLTPVQRRHFDANGKIINTHGEYPDAVRRLAANENVPLIDLHQMSKVLYEALGEKKSRKAFIHYPANTFPNQEKALEDNTHFNNYGGYEIARCVVEGIRQNGLSDILHYLRPEVQAFNPEKPDNVKKFSLPLSPFANIDPPDGDKVNLAKEKTAYLFSYFTGNGEDGLHLAYSRDGLTWTALNDGQSFLTPTIGKNPLMRDPSILQTPDGTFHLVWTSGWADRIIGYASSRDLIHWSEQRAIPVMMHEETAKNCWAPELFYDEPSKTYFIFWATTIPGRHKEVATSESEKGLNHRIYYVSTKDFRIFSETKLFFNPDFSVIDAAIVTVPNTQELLMVVKNENSNPPEKNLRTTRTKDIRKGFPTDVSPPITGDYWAEGPAPLFANDTFYVYFDRYRDHRYGAVRSLDFGETWEDVSHRVSFPKGTRHGTAFTVDETIVENLKQHGRSPSAELFATNFGASGWHFQWQYEN